LGEMEPPEARDADDSGPLSGERFRRAWTLWGHPGHLIGPFGWGWTLGMTDAQIEALIRKNYPVRNRRLAGAIEDGARRLEDRPLPEGCRCAICQRRERGGGLFPYQRRDGQRLLVGERCALYLGYLTARPDRANTLLGRIGR
jgi:hypothetical protein